MLLEESRFSQDARRAWSSASCVCNWWIRTLSSPPAFGGGGWEEGEGDAARWSIRDKSCVIWDAMSATDTMLVAASRVNRTLSLATYASTSSTATSTPLSKTISWRS